jgi:hypothetical protein
MAAAGVATAAAGFMGAGSTAAGSTAAGSVDFTVTSRVCTMVSAAGMMVFGAA